MAWDDAKTQLREATEEDMQVLLQEEALVSVPPVPEKVFHNDIGEEKIFPAVL